MGKIKIKRILPFIIFCSSLLYGQSDAFQIARLKYSGGGDWYNDQSAEVNLLNFTARAANIKVKAEYVYADLLTDEIFRYPFLFLTGHGNINFTPREAERLREYLEKGGFLYVDDDYGLDASFRREIKKVFPDKNLTELPFDYGMYHCLFDFKSGPPKIHEHDNKPPQGFGIFIGGRLAVYYTYQSNPSDGWVNAGVYNDPPAKREEALRFGANMIVWVLSH